MSAIRLAGAEAEALAQEHGTPYYLYDLDAALAHLAVLRANLPDVVDVFYCVKANGNKKVLEAFRPHVAGLDLSSAGELDMAIAAGYDPKHMSIAGPGKTTSDLERCVDRGCGIVSLESVAELGRLGAVARARGKRQDVTLRINPAETPKEFAMRMGGGASQFGVAEEEAPAALDAVKAEAGVRLAGLHIYAGTQCLEERALVDNMAGSLSIVARLADSHDLHPDVVNLGGGFGIPYFAGQKEVDTASLGRAIGAKLEEWRAAHPRFAKTRFVFELGRFLIGRFGAYVSRVTEIKETRGKRYVILDGGMHHVFPATGNFGQLVKKNYPVANLTRGGAEPESDANAPQEVCGPLCTPMDSLARGVRIARAEPGDLVGFFASGAYSFAASPLLFLSHDTPLELVKHGGEVSVARTRMPATRFW
ncbi:MAG: alanine racemase [Labilithrix sp.]|nr:alanine racemase [Labilithrix sp.]MCW5811288.1 alanine racemase [Labilithrix sp.]